MVFFRDKEGSPYSVQDPLAFLSAEAIDRRIRQNIEITSDDFPVKAAYVQGVRNAGATTFFTSRWANGVLVQCTPESVPAIEALGFVDHVEFVAPLAKLTHGGRRSFNFRKRNTHTGAETENQLRMLGIDRMQEANYTGKGITIAVLDSGFPGVESIAPFSNLFSQGRVNLDVSYDFVYNTANVFRYDDHGTEVLSVIAATVPDAYTGGAFEADFQLFVTEDVGSEYRVEEYNWLFAAERADSAGADIIHSSLGYYDFDDASMNYSKSQMDGKTTLVSRAAQWAADRGILVITSAGNEGNVASWRIISAPADGADVLAIGSVNSALQKSGSSSFGPSADGRIKPDLVALGVGVKVVKSSGVISTASGTSLSAPLVTSLAAGVWQRYPDLTNREVIALLRNSASQAANPDNSLGYGIPNFSAVVNYRERTDQTRPFEVFPNPLQEDTLTVSPRDPEVTDSCEIEIVSAQGQILGRETIRFSWLHRNYRLSLSGLASGIYYIRIFSGQQRHTFRLLKL